MTVTYNYANQIGGIIVNPTDGDNECDYIISAVWNHGAGTVLYTLDVFEGEEVYSREMPNTGDYREQALHDMTEEAQALNPGAVIYLHIDDDAYDSE